MALIKKVSQNWKKMDGDTLLEKKINAYLSSSYISDKECPSDECLSYAKKFARITNCDKKDEETIRYVLESHFFSATDKNGKTIKLSVPKGLIEKQIKKIFEMIQEGNSET